MKIQILGGGCPNCRALEENAKTAAANLGLAVEIDHVTDSDEILEMGVLRTPGYTIDGVLQASGSVSPVEEIERAMQAVRE